MQLDHPIPHKSSLPCYLFYYQHCKEPIYQLIPIPDNGLATQETIKNQIDDYVKFILGMQEDPLQTTPLLDVYDALGKPLSLPKSELPLPTNLFQNLIFRAKKNDQIERDGQLLADQEKEAAAQAAKLYAPSTTTTTTTTTGYQLQEDLEDPCPIYTSFTQPHTLTALQWAVLVAFDPSQPCSPATELDSKTLIHTIIDYYIEVILYGNEDGGEGVKSAGGAPLNADPVMNICTRPRPAPAVSAASKIGAGDDDEKADFKATVKL